MVLQSSTADSKLSNLCSANYFIFLTKKNKNLKHQSLEPPLLYAVIGKWKPSWITRELKRASSSCAVAIAIAIAMALAMNGPCNITYNVYNPRKHTLMAQYLLNSSTVPTSMLLFSIERHNNNAHSGVVPLQFNPFVERQRKNTLNWKLKSRVTAETQITNQNCFTFFSFFFLLFFFFASFSSFSSTPCYFAQLQWFLFSRRAVFFVYIWHNSHFGSYCNILY